MVDVSRLGFVAVLAGIVYLAAGEELFSAWMRWRRRDPFRHEASPIKRVLRIVAWGLALVGLICAAWAFVEPYLPETTVVRVPSSKLRDAVRIVHISDLHSDPQPRLEERLPDIIAELAPDIVVFSGDAINSSAGVPVFRRCMQRIAVLAPTFAVRGNWEVWWFADVDLFAGTGVHLLGSDPVPVRVRGEELWLAGADVGDEARIASTLAKVPVGRYTLFVHHFPAVWDGARRAGADLQLAGDTHGGQVVLPLLGPLVRLSRGDGRFYASGIHRSQGDRFLYVNRGLGMEGGSAPRVRFGCRPEITLLLVGGGASAETPTG